MSLFTSSPSPLSSSASSPSYHRTHNRYNHHHYHCIPKIPPSVFQNWNLKCLSHSITFMTRAVNVFICWHLPLVHLCSHKRGGETFQQGILSWSLKPFPKTQNKIPFSNYTFDDFSQKSKKPLNWIKTVDHGIVSSRFASKVVLFHNINLVE